MEDILLYHKKQISITKEINRIVDGMTNKEITQTEAKKLIKSLINNNKVLVEKEDGQLKTKFQERLGKKRARILSTMFPELKFNMYNI